MWDRFSRFKKELAKITPFYDFSYVCKYTDKPITLNQTYFRDAIHVDTGLGNILIGKITTNSSNDYGVLINNNNVDKILKSQKSDVNKFINNNKEFVKKYMNYGEKDFYYEEITQECLK